MSAQSFYSTLAAIGYDHPVHPIFVHVTIGLVVAALVFALISLSPRFHRYSATAGHCITFAFFSTLLTIAFGLIDWSHYYGAALTPVFKMKLILAGVLCLFLGVSAFLFAKVSERVLTLIPTYLAAFLTVIGLGYYGGELIHAPRGGSTTDAEECECETTDESGAVRFSQINRILQDNCVQCHQPNNKIAGLDLSSYDAVMAGGENGAVVVPGTPDESELLLRVNGTAPLQMPLGGQPLSERDVERIARWIEEGAPQGD